MVKTDIDAEKPDFDKLFQNKTAQRVLQLQKAFIGQKFFGRADVMKEIGIKASRASELLRTMLERGIIEPVSGHGKGKYRFR